MKMCTSYLVVRLMISVCGYEVDSKTTDDYFTDHNSDLWLLDMGH